jgi:hypothetical protein
MDYFDAKLMLRSIRWTSLLGLFALAACDRPSHDHPYFPLAQGRSWTYEVTAQLDGPEGRTDITHTTLTNMGRETLNSADAWRRRSSEGIQYWLRQDDKGGIVRVASKSPLEARATLDAFPRVVLPQQMVMGATWQTDTTLYLLRRRSERPAEFRLVDKYKAIPMTYTVTDLNQKVSTPAGQFDGCALVSGRADVVMWVEAAMSFKPTPVLTREWYCPDIGLVQLEREEPTTARFFQGGHLRMSLTAWQ